jgi:predicted metal-dependent hydrolase
MTHTIFVDDQEIVFEMKRRRRTRSMTVRVYDDGAVIVTRPYWAANKDVFAFVEKNASWIIKSQSRATIIHPDIREQSYDHYEDHKEAARALVHNKIAQWNAHYNFDYNRVSIRQARTRWGSCSSKGNLSFNYKIIFLPEELQDYLIVHELCHLQEMNHSKNFWNLVGETIPDYKELRKKLKNNLF